MVYSPKVGPKGPALVRFHVIKKINNKKKDVRIEFAIPR